MLNKLLFLFILLITNSVQAASNSPQVVVTIKPIHALAMGVMAGGGEPYLLLQGGESPHTYSMKPSQIKQLNDADLIIWVGPELETFLEKTITQSNKQNQVLTLLTEGKNPFSANTLKLYSIRESQEWAPHEHESHDNEHDLGGIDPHIWLDPRNAINIVKMIATRLAELDAVHAALYQSNASGLIVRLEQLDQALNAQLLPIKAQSFIVFHDAYQYLEKRYDLNAIGAVSVSPEHLLSAKQLHHLHQLIEEKQVRCLFAEPQFPPILVDTLISETKIKSGILDPLGSELTMGVDNYFMLLNKLAQSLTACLADSFK